MCESKEELEELMSYKDTHEKRQPASWNLPGIAKAF
jgi:hypothetical protein